ncbi:MAG: DUF4377 domain-containing protein [Leptospirales bacterium]
MIPNQTEEKVVYIKHTKGECRGMVYSLCMITKDRTNGSYDGVYGYINGFHYEWGYNYKLLIEIETLTNPPTDGGSERYTLLQQKDKKLEPLATLFEISVSEPQRLILLASGTEYEIYNEKKFTCSPADCTTIGENINLNIAMLFEFTHNANPTQPLNLVRIKCSAPVDTFANACLL